MAGAKNRAPATDASVARVLSKGEPVAPPSGRADDFSWPRAGVNIDTNLPDAPPGAALPGAATADKAATGQRTRVSLAPAPQPRRPAATAALMRRALPSRSACPSRFLISSADRRVAFRLVDSWRSLRLAPLDAPRGYLDLFRARGCFGERGQY